MDGEDDYSDESTWPLINGYRINPMCIGKNHIDNTNSHVEFKRSVLGKRWTKESKESLTNLLGE